jgi:hypothetical protein
MDGAPPGLDTGVVAGTATTQPIGFVDRLGRFTQVMEVAQLIGHPGPGSCHCLADRVLAIGEAAADGHRHSLAHLGQQRLEIRDRGREEAAGHQHLAGKAITHHPQYFVADVGLEAVDGSDDAALRGQEGMQSLAGGRGQSAQLMVTVQEIGDRAQGNGDTSARQFAMDLGDASMFGVTEAADQGQDVKAELVMGQSDEGLGFRPRGAVVAQAIGVGAAAKAQGEPRDGVERGDGAVFGLGRPKEMTALRAASNDRRESLGLCGARPPPCPCHG